MLRKIPEIEKFLGRGSGFSFNAANLDALNPRDQVEGMMQWLIPPKWRDLKYYRNGDLESISIKVPNLFFWSEEEKRVFTQSFMDKTRVFLKKDVSKAVSYMLFLEKSVEEGALKGRGKAAEQKISDEFERMWEGVSQASQQMKNSFPRAGNYITAQYFRKEYNKQTSLDFQEFSKKLINIDMHDVVNYSDSKDEIAKQLKNIPEDVFKGTSGIVFDVFNEVQKGKTMSPAEIKTLKIAAFLFDTAIKYLKEVKFGDSKERKNFIENSFLMESKNAWKPDTGSMLNLQVNDCDFGKILRNQWATDQSVFGSIDFLDDEMYQYSILSFYDKFKKTPFRDRGGDDSEMSQFFMSFFSSMTLCNNGKRDAVRDSAQFCRMNSPQDDMDSVEKSVEEKIRKKLKRTFDAFNNERNLPRRFAAPEGVAHASSLFHDAFKQIFLDKKDVYQQEHGYDLERPKTVWSFSSIQSPNYEWFRACLLGFERWAERGLSDMLVWDPSSSKDAAVERISQSFQKRLYGEIARVFVQTYPWGQDDVVFQYMHQRFPDAFVLQEENQVEEPNFEVLFEGDERFKMYFEAMEFNLENIFVDLRKADDSEIWPSFQITLDERDELLRKIQPPKIWGNVPTTNDKFFESFTNLMNFVEALEKNHPCDIHSRLYDRIKKESESRTKVLWGDKRSKVLSLSKSITFSPYIKNYDSLKIRQGQVLCEAFKEIHEPKSGDDLLTKIKEKLTKNQKNIDLDETAIKTELWKRIQDGFSCEDVSFSDLISAFGRILPKDGITYLDVWGDIKNRFPELKILEKISEKQLSDESWRKVLGEKEKIVTELFERDEAGFPTKFLKDRSRVVKGLIHFYGLGVQKPHYQLSNLKDEVDLFQKTEEDFKKKFHSATYPRLKKLKDSISTLTPQELLRGLCAGTNELDENRTPDESEKILIRELVKHIKGRMGIEDIRGFIKGALLETATKMDNDETLNLNPLFQHRVGVLRCFEGKFPWES